MKMFMSGKSDIIGKYILFIEIVHTILVAWNMAW